MHSPITASPEFGQSQLLHQHNQKAQAEYSTSEESYSSQSETREDGTTVTRVEYSSQRSSYIVSLNSGEADYSANTTLTYSSLNQHYHLSSQPDTVTEEAGVAGEATTTSTQTLSSSTGIGETNPLLDGAKNILHFIEQRIASEKADGASEAELAELWEQGLKGFVEGFNEAYGILEESGQLSGEVEASIETLSTQVYAGFDAIYDQYIGSRGNEGPETESNDDSQQQAVTTPLFSPSPQGNNVAGPRQVFSSNPLMNNAADSANEQFTVLGSGSRGALSELISSLGDVDATVEYGRKDSFSFELKTLDGDTISINASNTAVFYGEYDVSAEVDGEQSVEGMKDKNNFSMDIVGELDEQEKAAIQDLLNQIMSLADEFYNGDIDKAYEAALELGYDQNEIASFSINLRQTEQFNVAAAYQDQQPSLPGEAKEAFTAIGDFAQSVLETLNNPENYAFFDYTQLLKGISEQIDQQIAPSTTQSFSDAVEQLVDTANQVEVDNSNNGAAA